MRLDEKVNTINLKNIFCSYNFLICLSSVYSKKNKPEHMWPKSRLKHHKVCFPPSD